jgi:hypothetical protein
MPIEGKTYLSLAEHPEIQVTKCQQVLSNHMQCWRAGDFQITTITLTPTEDEPNHVDILTYQKCRAHTAWEQDADAKTAADEAAQAAEKATIAAVIANSNAATKK